MNNNKETNSNISYGNDQLSVDNLYQMTKFQAPYGVFFLLNSLSLFFFGPDLNPTDIADHLDALLSPGNGMILIY